MIKLIYPNNHPPFRSQLLPVGSTVFTADTIQEAPGNVLN